LLCSAKLGFPAFQGHIQSARTVPSTHLTLRLTCQSRPETGRRRFSWLAHPVDTAPVALEPTPRTPYPIE